MVRVLVTVVVVVEDVAVVAGVGAVVVERARDVAGTLVGPGRCDRSGETAGKSSAYFGLFGHPFSIQPRPLLSPFPPRSAGPLYANVALTITYTHRSTGAHTPYLIFSDTLRALSAARRGGPTRSGHAYLGSTIVRIRAPPCPPPTITSTPAPPSESVQLTDSNLTFTYRDGIYSPRL
jgi:hypothetical protein